MALREVPWAAPVNRWEYVIAALSGTLQRFWRMLRHRLGCDPVTCPYARAYHAAMRRAEAAEKARPPVDEAILRQHQGVTRLLARCAELDATPRRSPAAALAYSAIPWMWTSTCSPAFMSTDDIRRFLRVDLQEADA